MLSSRIGFYDHKQSEDEKSRSQAAWTLENIETVKTIDPRLLSIRLDETVPTPAEVHSYDAAKIEDTKPAPGSYYLGYHGMCTVLTRPNDTASSHPEERDRETCKDLGVYEHRQSTPDINHQAFPGKKHTMSLEPDPQAVPSTMDTGKIQGLSIGFISSSEHKFGLPSQSESLTGSTQSHVEHMEGRVATTQGKKRAIELHEEHDQGSSQYIQSQGLPANQILTLC